MRPFAPSVSAIIALLMLLIPGWTRAQVAATGDGPTLRLETGRHTAAIKGLGADAAGRYVVTESDDKTARVWDARSGALLSVLRPPLGAGSMGMVFAAALSPDGRTVACGGYTARGKQPEDIYLFDRATGRIRVRIGGLPNVTERLTYSPDGRFLAAVFGQGGVRVFRASDGAPAGQDTLYADQAYGASFSGGRGPRRLATACWDGVVRLYDVSPSGALRLRARRAVPGGPRPHTVAFSPDGSRVAVGYLDRPQVSVLSGANLAPLFSPDVRGIPESDSDLSCVCWSADGRFLYAGGRFWDGKASAIRRWSDGGRGGHTDVGVSGDTVTALEPRAGGGVFFAAGDPAWGALGGAGRRTAFVGPAILRFTDDPAAFRVSEQGSAVALNNSLAFSLPGRALVSGKAGPALQPPDTQTDVQNWQDSGKPTLEGRPLPLEPYETSHCLAAAPDRRHFLLGADYRLYCFTQDGEKAWSVPAPSACWDVNVSGDGRLAVAAFTDGTVHWYRMEDGGELLALFPHPDRRRWVAWTPSGYFDCSPGGEGLIGWQVGRGPDRAADFFPVGRFRNTFYRPDVVGRVLSAASEAEALRQADDAAGRRQEPVATAASVSAALPPVVSLLSPQDGEAVSSDRVTVRYSVQAPPNAPASGVRVLLDGRPLAPARDLRVGAANTATAGQMTVTIPHRDCVLSVIAASRDAASEPASVRLLWRPSVPAPPSFAIKPTLYVLAVGISRYRDPALALDYPADDARAFADVMSAQAGRLYAGVQTRVLLDGDATRAAVADGLEWVERQTTQHDVAMVFLAGHGANDRDGNYLFIPADFDRERIKSTGLPFSDIKDTVQNLAGKTLVFVDSCHAGNVLGTGKGRAVDVNGAVNELSSAENGAVVFAASTGSQVALEDRAWGHGAFTKALVEGLGGRAAFNHDGKITVDMLDLYVSQRVKELTRGQQTPTTAKPQTVPDFPIALTRGP